MEHQPKATPRLSFREALEKAFTQPVNSRNRRRVRRSEYWWCMLACTVYVAFFTALHFLLEDIIRANMLGWLDAIFFTLVSIPPVGLFALETYGRLHDTNHRDTWLMGIVIPLLFVALSYLMVSLGHPMLGAGMSSVVLLRHVPVTIASVFLLICIVFCLKDSDPDENDYGPSPKYRQD